MWCWCWCRHRIAQQLPSISGRSSPAGAAAVSCSCGPGRQQHRFLGAKAWGSGCSAAFAVAPAHRKGSEASLLPASWREEFGGQRCDWSWLICTDAFAFCEHLPKVPVSASLVLSGLAPVYFYRGGGGAGSDRLECACNGAYSAAASKFWSFFPWNKHPPKFLLSCLPAAD